jgi:hypothetical protein
MLLFIDRQQVSALKHDSVSLQQQPIIRGGKLTWNTSTTSQLIGFFRDSRSFIMLV